MTPRRLALAALATSALGGCPLPQPLPGAGKAATPLRIYITSVVPGASAIPFDPACPGGAQFQLGGEVVDEDVEEQVEARWFVDYDPVSQQRSTPFGSETLPPPQDQEQTHRPLASFAFRPGDFDAPPPFTTLVHVVEVVISNGFLPQAPPSPNGGLTNRLTDPAHEIQLFRWVFEPVPGSGACGP
jgi:hypothetical protein